MQTIRDINEIQLIEKKRYIALGVFDGIHLGHKKLIENAVSSAKINGGLSMVMTFEPHPDRIIFPEKRHLHITTMEEKKEIIKAIGVDILFILKFGPWIKNMQPEVFIRRILKEKLKAKEIFVGFNYKFGFKGKGNIDFLKNYENHYHYKTHVIEPKIIDGNIVSSTLIKKFIEKGDIERAEIYLGHNYTISGKVVPGKNIGTRIMRIPTANISIPGEKIIPPNGVYLVSAKLGSNKYYGLMNIGYRPTFKGEEKSVEVHIFNFEMDIYEKDLTCIIMKRIRDEINFDSPIELRDQIIRDINLARKIITGKDRLVSE